MSTSVIEKEFEDLAQSVDLAMEEVRKLGEDKRAVAKRLKDAVEALNKHVLVKIVQHFKADEKGKELLFELLEDQAVRAAFMMHGIIKPDLTARAAQVLELVKPYMQSHGGDVELVRVEDNTAFIRLHGSCNGCSLSSVTLRNGVEEALKEHVPEITSIEVVPNEPGPAFISLESIDVLEDTGWIEGPSVEVLSNEKPYRLESDGHDILIIQLEEKIYAYKNSCAHMGQPLDGGMIDENILTCPWHGFKFDLSTGECITVPQAQLEPYPLRVDDNVVWVRPQA